MSRAAISARHSPLRILHFLPRSGHRIEPHIGEEDRPRRGPDPTDPERCEVGEVAGVECGERDDREHGKDGEFKQHHDGVDQRGFAGAANEQDCAHDDEQDRGKIEPGMRCRGIGAVPRRGADRMRQMPSEEIDQELVKVLAPADGDRRGRHPIFQQQAGCHYHRRQLTQGCVGVGERGTRYRYGGG